MNGWNSRRLRLTRDADARVGDLEAHDLGLVATPSRRTRTTTPPAWVNLIALPTRLSSTWRSRPGSPVTTRGHVRLDRRSRQLEALAPGRAGPAGRDVLDDRAQVEVDRLQLELARLDLREVQDVVDDAEQRLARPPNRLGVLALLRRERRVEQQARHADHAVHRRADLVAHHRQELATSPGRTPPPAARAPSPAPSWPAAPAGGSVP